MKKKQQFFRCVVDDNGNNRIVQIRFEEIKFEYSKFIKSREFFFITKSCQDNQITDFDKFQQINYIDQKF